MKFSSVNVQWSSVFRLTLPLFQGALLLLLRTSLPAWRASFSHSHAHVYEHRHTEACTATGNTLAHARIKEKRDGTHWHCTFSVLMGILTVWHLEAFVHLPPWGQSDFYFSEDVPQEIIILAECLCHVLTSERHNPGMLDLWISSSVLASLHCQTLFVEYSECFTNHNDNNNNHNSIKLVDVFPAAEMTIFVRQQNVDIGPFCKTL